MRKYIIVPVLLAVVLVMMCHCTSDRKATVPANEYLIQGELANLSDSIVIGLYVDEGNIFNLVARDTLLNGKFSFRDTVSVTKKMLIMSDNKGFPGTWLEVWIAPGEYIEIKGEDKLLKTWEVVSDIPEQAEENRFTACAMAQQKELMQHLAAEYDWQRMMFIDHAGDQEFEKKGWAKIDSIRKLTTPLRQEIWKKELEYMKEIVSLGFEVIISGVFAYGLDESWLGRKIDDKAIDELVEINKKVGINLAFEGGEAETLAVDGPIFKKRINILKDKKTWHLDSGLYIIEEAELEDK